MSDMRIGRKKVGIIILAAGNSTRFGSPKQLFKYHGVTLIRRAALSAINVGVGPVIVSTGAEHRAVEKELAGLVVTPAFNPDWQSGMSSSLTSALKSLTSTHSNVDAVVFMLCDQPLIDREKLSMLIKTYETTDSPIVASEYSGTLGVPALFDRSMFGELMQLTGDEGAKSVIRKNAELLARVPMPEAAYDIDSIGDVENN